MTTDTCSACHVMHASQIGMGLGTYTPRQSLLKTGCEGCHAEIAGSSIGPAVLNSTTDLAGGDFAYSSIDERMGHNPNEISTNDSLAEPPGWKSSFTDSENNQVASTTAGAWSADTLSCAGNFGCHGNHSLTNTILSLEKAHHNNSSGLLQPLAGSATVGGSFRFLHGVKGYEDPDWQATVGNADHNVYYDEARTGAEAAGDRVDDKQTISYLCAQCHGKFHSGTGNEGLLEAGGEMFVDPWIRHPVSVLLPTPGEFDSYGAFNDNAPVASTSVQIPGSHDTSIAALTDRVVSCLSCHRAHASPYYASMRWDYRGTAGDTVNGCTACHSSKQ